MANTLRIKRSASTNEPTSLLQGELANSESGSPNGINELWVGTTGPTVYKLIRNLNASPAEPTAGLADAVLGSTDYLVFEDVSDSQGKRELVSDIPLSIFNDTGYANQTITTGLGIDGADAGDAGNITLSLATTELASVAALAADQLVFNDDTDELPKKQAISSFPVSIWGTATADINMADFDINRPVLEDYGVKHTAPTVSANAVTVDCVNGNSFAIDMDPATAAVALTLSNPSASGTYCEVTLHIIMGTPAWGITWPGSVTWFAGGTAPTLTSVDNGVDTVHLYTIDGGTNWYGTYANRDAAAGGGTVTDVTGGLGITSTGGDTPDIALALTELSVVTAAAADWIAIEDATDNSTKKALISATSVGLFDNATTEYVSENDTIVVVDWNWVLDEDAMGTNSAVHVATQQSIKAYVDNAVTGALTHKGGYNAATNTPALDTGSPVLEIGDMYTVTVAGTFFTVEVEVGDVLISDVDSSDAADVNDWTIVQSNIGAASETVAGYIRIATQAEVDAEASALIAVTPAYMHETTFDGGTF